MKSLSVLLFAGILFSGFCASAQKVIRKGMPPLTHGPAGTASQPALYTIDQLTGRWQEVKRADSPEFKDTLLIYIHDGRGSVKDDVDMSMAMDGTASIEAPSTLVVAGSAYEIQRLHSNTLVLRDDEHVRTMRRVGSYAYERAGNDSVHLPVYTTPITPKLGRIAGKWLIYRRDAPPGLLEENSILIKSLTIGDSDGGSAKGEIVLYGADNIARPHPCTFSVTGTQLRVVTDGRTYRFNVYKAEREELVFGFPDAVMNYARH